ncbi:MAG: hypothetical protein JWM71_1089 [Solirubrobacteraceae bacterium]|nr:hypothetical protein [Solirubrobacteraceae bacterium]
MPLSTPLPLRQRAAFEDTVRRLRQGKGWTQEDLGDRVAFDRKSINRVENTAYSPSVYRLFALANVLGVAPSELVADADVLSRRKRPGKKPSPG